MIGAAAEYVVKELSDRAESRGALPRQPHRTGPPKMKMLRVPNLASIRVLSERSTSDRRAVAVAVEDADGERYVVIRELVYEGDELCMAGGSEGCDQVIPGKSGPYLDLYAYANGRFFAGGRVQSGGFGVVRARLVWEDGYALEDTVENGIAMFLGRRDFLDPAMVEFLDQTGGLVGCHQAFGPDER